jgi:hypothetical protein
MSCEREIPFQCLWDQVSVCTLNTNCSFSLSIVNLIEMHRIITEAKHMDWQTRPGNYAFSLCTSCREYIQYRRKYTRNWSPPPWYVWLIPLLDMWFYISEEPKHCSSTQNQLNIWLIALFVTLWNNILWNRSLWILLFLLQNLELIRITSYKRSVPNTTPSFEEWVIIVMLSLYFIDFIIFCKHFVPVNSKSLLFCLNILFG